MSTANHLLISERALLQQTVGWIAILELNGQQQSIFWPETLAVMTFSAA